MFIIRYDVWKLLTVISLSLTASLFAQDTLRLSIMDAQKEFTDKNFQLIVQKFNIDANKAQILQAKLYVNPSISLEQGLLTRQVQINGQVWGPFAQHAIQIQQLFILAGKRNKNIQLASINTEISEYLFFDLLRTLYFSLSTNFFELGFQLKTLAVYQEEIATIRKLVIAYRELQKDGNVAFKEVVRLESFLFSLESDRNQLELAIAQNQSDLRMLLGMGTNTFIIPVINEPEIETLNIQKESFANLIEVANENRFDLKGQESSLKYANVNLALQKAYRVPDVTLGYTYDRGGSYTINYHAITLEMNLPVWNQNQGNIKTAEIVVKSNEKMLEQIKVAMYNDVILAYNQTQKIESLYQNFDKGFVSNFNKLIQGVIEGYKKKTISLVEFMDFFDSYKQNVVQFNSLRSNRVNSYLQINYSVGKNVFSF
jgi:cobalt-zinc-cadmium efflux system outer membrane protein